MKKSYLNILKIAGLLFMSSYIIVQIYSSVYNPLTTETASYINDIDGVMLKGYTVRSESILRFEGTGIKDIVVNDGSRIAKDSVVANVYTTAADATGRQHLRELDARIAALEELQYYADSSAANIEIIKSTVQQSYINLLGTSGRGSFNDMNKYANDLLSSLSKKQIATGETGEFSALLSGLNSERTRTLSALAEPANTVATETSGYFITSVDGFENILKPEEIDKLYPEKLKSIAGAKVDYTGIIGKVVDDGEWYIASAIDEVAAANFTVGQEVSLVSSNNTFSNLSAVVHALIKPEEGQDITIVFKCNHMNDELATVRVQNYTVVLNAYSGLKINTKAIRVVDAKKGVYIMDGSTAKFKTVDIVYTGDGYSVCKLDNSVSDSLRLYDEVIIKGKNLYDNKVIK